MVDAKRPTGKRGGTKETNSGNFANDPERAARAGHKGGKLSGENFAMIDRGLRRRGAKAGRAVR